MKSFNQRYLVWLLIFVLCLAHANRLAAQGATETAKTGAEVATLKLDSKMMAREMPYRVIVPTDYKSKSAERFPVIYLLHGLTGNYANWSVLTKLGEYSKKHSFIIVMPDGGNGWYTDSITVSDDKYESYIVKEMIPEIDKTYRTLATRENRFMAGLSMGGYGSLKFGLKFPEMFSMIGSFSGAVSAANYTEKNAATAGRGIDKIMGLEDSDKRKANDVFKLICDLTPEKIQALPYVFQSCGTEDFLIKDNRDLLTLLNEKKIPHEYREHPGVHNWVFWDDQVREFLDLAERRLKK